MPELEKPITVMLDRERHVRLTLKGMLEFQKLTGKNLLKGFKTENLDESAALIWACLIHEDKELTYDNVLCLIDLSNMTTVMSAITECIERSLREPGKVDENPLAEMPRPG